MQSAQYKYNQDRTIKTKKRHDEIALRRFILTMQPTNFLQHELKEMAKSERKRKDKGTIKLTGR